MNGYERDQLLLQWYAKLGHTLEFYSEVDHCWWTSGINRDTDFSIFVPKRLYRLANQPTITFRPKHPAL